MTALHIGRQRGDHQRSSVRTMRPRRAGESLRGSPKVGGHYIVVDAIDDDAASFHLPYDNLIPGNARLAHARRQRAATSLGLPGRRLGSLRVATNGRSRRCTSAEQAPAKPVTTRSTSVNKRPAQWPRSVKAAGHESAPWSTSKRTVAGSIPAGGAQMGRSEALLVSAFGGNPLNVSVQRTR